MREFKAQVGFLTIAQNNQNTDYLNLAYIQAQNIKATQPNSQYAVLVDEQTMSQVTDEHRAVFDYIIQFNLDQAANEQWKQSNEWQVFYLTPFKETIKLESDLLFTRDILHWFDALRLRDICFSYNCRDYQSNVITRTPYRQLFERNEMPDIYTGMYYFRFSKTAADFFKLVRSIYDNWAVVKDQLTQCDAMPSTDVAFSLATKIYGIEQCTIPTLDFFNFAHMKSAIQGWGDNQPWTDYVNVERDGSMLRINNLNQYNPVHYHEKTFNDPR